VLIIVVLGNIRGVLETALGISVLDDKRCSRGGGNGAVVVYEKPLAESMLLLLLLWIRRSASDCVYILESLIG
jgi:hypothetical protein